MKKHLKKHKNMDAKDRVLSKFTTGRTKAIKKRKKTLLVEYKLLNKANKFVDRRIGEKNRNMTSEDRLMARFVAQRMKSHNKKQMFNLENTEVLTHRGRTLEDIEKFESVRSDSDDEEGNLDAKYVEKSHFGGGLFSKVSDGEGSRQNTIDQLIIESKRRKAERQMIKEETQILTEKLDKDLKDLFPAVNKHDSKELGNEIKSKPDKESYDVLVRELKFEPVGRPSNKLKSEDQLEKEQKEKLAIFEKQRLERMKRVQDIDEDQDIPPEKKHISADDLDDGLDLDMFCDDEESGEEKDDDEEDENDDEEEEDEGNESESQENDIDADVPKKLEQRKTTIQTKKPSIVPETIEDLLQEIGDKNVAEKIETIKNLIQVQKIHTGVSIKENMISFFKVLIEYVDSLFTSSIEQDSWDFLNRLSPVLFELTQIGGDDIASIVIALLKQKYKHYSSLNKKNVPVDTLVLFKLIPLLFPTSDYYHPVATPMAVFVSQILNENSCKTLNDIAKGLFLCTTMLEFIHLSKRYCPETLNFLKSVLYVAIPNFLDAYPPVKSDNKILTLKNCHAKSAFSSDKLKLSFLFLSEDIEKNDDNIVLLLYTTLKILDAYCHHYEDYSAVRAIWSPVSDLINKLPVESLPQSIVAEVENLSKKIETLSKRSLSYLLGQKKRPKALRLYEPNIRPIIDGKSFRTVSQAKLEKEKLIHQYKKEKKGAYREIRKDQKLLTRVALAEQAKRDSERKEKVKQIFNWGQNQQSEYKRMERKNRFKR